MLDTFASPFCVSISSFSQQFYTLGWFAMSIFMILIIREQQESYIYQTIFWFLKGKSKETFLLYFSRWLIIQMKLETFLIGELLEMQSNGEEKNKTIPKRYDQQFVGDLFLFGTVLLLYSHIYKREL